MEPFLHIRMSWCLLVEADGPNRPSQWRERHHSQNKKKTPILFLKKWFHVFIYFGCVGSLLVRGLFPLFVESGSYPLVGGAWCLIASWLHCESAPSPSRLPEESRTSARSPTSQGSHSWFQEAGASAHIHESPGFSSNWGPWVRLLAPCAVKDQEAGRACRVAEVAWTGCEPLQSAQEGSQQWALEFAEN